MASSFNGQAFKEIVVDTTFVSGYEADAQIDVQASGTTTSYDVGDSIGLTLDKQIRCPNAALNTFVAWATVGQAGTLVLSSGSHYALLKAVKSVRRHANPAIDECLAVLSFLAP